MLRPVRGLDTAMEGKVAVGGQKHERPEKVSPAFLSIIGDLALDIELLRMQRRIALDQNVLPGQFLELHQP